MSSVTRTYTLVQLPSLRTCCAAFSLRLKACLVRPLMRGASGVSVLWAQPSYPHSGSGLPFVVKFGDFRKIDQEYANFKTHVQPFIGGGRTTTVVDLRRTPLLGGIMYSLLGASNDRFEDFGSYYHHAKPDQIKTVLDRLFFDTCGTWYASPGQVATVQSDVRLPTTAWFHDREIRRSFR